jgi:hypothetical protein
MLVGSNMRWISLALLALATILLALHNTGSEPFVEFAIADAWLLGFAPGALATLWVILAAVSTRKSLADGRYPSLAIVVFLSLIGVGATVSVPWMYFGDLASHLHSATEK